MVETRSREAWSLLTPREKEVLYYLARGFTNKMIGSLLHIEDSTVKNHVSGILSSLGVSSRTEAALEGYKRGILRGIGMDYRLVCPYCSNPILLEGRTTDGR
jgi:DNA-binding NarL/FixJ family response regulator